MRELTTATARQPCFASSQIRPFAEQGFFHQHGCLSHRSSSWPCRPTGYTAWRVLQLSSRSVRCRSASAFLAEPDQGPTLFLRHRYQQVLCSHCLYLHSTLGSGLVFNYPIYTHTYTLYIHTYVPPSPYCPIHPSMHTYNVFRWWRGVSTSPRRVP